MECANKLERRIDVEERKYFRSVAEYAFYNNKTNTLFRK